MSGFDHDCPGDCGAAVPRYLFACRPCWFRLPIGIRNAVVDNYRVDEAAHMRAMSEAFEWYSANPRADS